MNKQLAAKLCVVAIFLTAIIPTNALAYGQKWDVGRDWTVLNGSGSVQESMGVATSDDGRIVYSVGTNVYPQDTKGVRYSDDFGATWTVRDSGVSLAGFSDVTTSSDGAIVAFTQNGGNIYVSRNFGITWEKKTEVISHCWNDAMGPGRGQWLNISMSATGQYMVLVECGKLFRSDDFGATFTKSSISNITASNSDMTPKISISDDGQRVILGNSVTQKVYISYNSGLSFSSISALPAAFWGTVAVSGDGQTFIAAPRGANLWFSHDSGATWQESALDLDPRYKSWVNAVVSYDGTYMAVTRGGYKIITSESRGRSWEVRPGSPTKYWTGMAASSDGRIMYATANYYNSLSGGVFKSIPTYIWTDYGQVTLLLEPCWESYDFTSVQAASVVLMGDTASAIANGDDSTYTYFSETDTALWGANYNYGSIQDQNSCVENKMNGTVTLTRGRFMSSTDSVVLSETTTNTTGFIQYIGNIESGGTYSGLPCGNMGVVRNTSNVTTSCTTAIQANYQQLTYTNQVQVRGSSIKVGRLGQDSGKIYTFVKVLNSAIAGAPRANKWVATETFTVTSS